jgi:hypothetical protein
MPGILEVRITGHFADKRRSLGRYSSLADSDHGIVVELLVDC